MWQLEGTTAVVSRAGSGIGQALALGLHGYGCRVALLDQDLGGLLHTLRLLAPPLVDVDASVATWQVDVASAEAMRGVARDVVRRLGPVDLVINDAGLEQAMGLTVHGVVNSTQAFLPFLLERPEAAVVNVSGAFAVRGYTDSLRTELRRRTPSVRAVSVHPGGHIAGHTPGHGDGLATERPVSPGRAATTIIKGIQRRRERIVLGREGGPSDLLSRLLAASSSELALRRVVQGGSVPPPVPRPRRHADTC